MLVLTTAPGEGALFTINHGRFDKSLLSKGDICHRGRPWLHSARFPGGCHGDSFRGVNYLFITIPSNLLFALALMQNKRTSCFPCLFPGESSSQAANVCLSELTDVIRFYKLTGYGSHLSFTILLHIPPPCARRTEVTLSSYWYFFICLSFAFCLFAVATCVSYGRTVQNEGCESQGVRRNTNK